MRKFEAVKIAPWLVLLIGLCVTLLTWESARSDSIKILHEEFDFNVSQIASRLEKRAQDARLILQGTAGLFHASDNVTRKEFRTYVESLDLRKNYPGIRDIAVTRLIQARDKAQFMQRAKQDGSPDGFNIRPDGERDMYAPVLYLEPASEQTKLVMGYDLYSNPQRRSAMDLACDTGKPTITDQVTFIVQNKNVSEEGFLMFAPVYRTGKAHETIEERRANIVGWVQLAFVMDEMTLGAIDDIADNLSGQFIFQIFMGDTTSPETKIYKSQAAEEHRHDRREALLKSSRTIPISNKHLTLVVHSTEAFEARVNDTKAKTILIAGLCCTILLALVIWQMSRGRVRAVQIAKRISRDMIGREKRYRQMFEDNATISYILDPASGNIIDANAVAAKFWGYSIEELREKNISEINILPLVEVQIGMQQQVKAGNNGHFNFRHRLKNGDIRDVEIYRSILTYENHTFIYCIAHDITSRKQAETALSESEAKLHAIIETAMDAVVQLDSRGVIIDWNTRAEKTFGWSKQEIVGKSLIDSIIPMQQHAVYLDGLKRFQEDENAEVRHSQFEIEARSRDGQEFPIEVAITTMMRENGQPEYCAFIHDITNRRKSENALRKARIELENRVFERTAELVRTNRRLNTEISERSHTQEALQQSQEMLRQLVAHQDRIRENERKRIAREIHDELGQHLLVLRIDVSMLGTGDSEPKKLSGKIDGILQHIDLTMRSVRAIINNLRPSVLDLGLYAALEWQAEEFQRRSGIACDLVTEDEDLELEDSTATVLFRIVQEALTNVLRHAKASRVRIELHREAGRLLMTIEDNGIGMNKTQRSEQKSFGLVGIRERLNILGGELTIDSTSSGTVLTVSLPMTDVGKPVISV